MEEKMAAARNGKTGLLEKVRIKYVPLQRGMSRVKERAELSPVAGDFQPGSAQKRLKYTSPLSSINVCRLEKSEKM